MSKGLKAGFTLTIIPVILAALAALLHKEFWG